jgi:regulator of sigma E protease
MLLLTIIIFIVIFGLLIFVHELGHFVAAKISGVKVEEFGFGFPPKIFGIKRGETTYTLNLIPLGGFVRMLGEEEVSDSPRSFNKKPIAKRLFIIVAGVLMNLVLAVVVLTIGFSIGMSPIVSDPATIGGKHQTEIIIADVKSGSPAEKVGLKQGDIITGFDTIENLQNFTKAHQNQEVTFSIKQNDVNKEVKVTLGATDAPLGIAMVQATKVQLGFLGSVKQAFIEIGRTIITIFSFLYSLIHDLFVGKKGVAEQVAGPVGIFSITQQAVKLGVSYVLQFTALLTINLAVMNILPIPALDGGRVLFLALEGIKGKKVIKEEIENMVHWVGFLLLIALFILITYNDIVRLIKG